MAEDELVPELHDIGKLLDNEALASAMPGWPTSGHTFTDDKDNPLDLAGSFNLPQPASVTWFGIVNHHERAPRQAQINDLKVGAWRDQPAWQAAAWQLVLLQAADHLAASTSRAVDQESGGKRDQWHQLKTSVYQPLWRSGEGGPRSFLLTTHHEVAALLNFVAQKPTTWADFIGKYGEELSKIPEEKGFPRAVTTLRTHVDLVGRYYRVLRRHSVFESRQGRRAIWYEDLRALSCAEVEQNWRFRLARCRARIPAVPARLRDLGVFQRLEEALETLQADVDRKDHLLLATFQDLWLFLPREAVRSMEDVLKPLLEAGFHVEATVREAPLTNLTDWGDWDHEAQESFRYLQPASANVIDPPLCEVCQLAQGYFWQKRPDNAPEYLCASCAETRERYSQRFERLEEWDSGYAAWLRVFLDFRELEKHLQELFSDYVATRGDGIIDAGTQEGLVKNLRTTALNVDYVNDFLAMLDDLSGRLAAVFPANDVEALTAKRKELFVVRVDTRSDVFRLLELCHVAASRHFPRSLPKPPFRFAISLGPVRFPFGEHWRLLQEARDEVTVSLIGSGRLACRLETVPELLSLAKQPGAPRRGLHRLADLAAQSSALARVALADREERDLAGLAPRLRELGLDFDSMAAFARLTKA